MPNRPDIILIEDYKLDNDVKALGILWERHKDDVYNAILAKVNFNEAIAEDILQDCFIRMKNAIDNGTYNDDKNIKGWLCTIGRNMTIDHQRRKKRIPSTPVDVSITDDQDIDFIWNIFGSEKSYADDIMDQETLAYTKEKIRLLLDKIPKSQSEIARMRFFEEIPFKDIAEQLDVSINTAIGRMRYALISMRKIIEKEGLFPDDASKPIIQPTERTIMERTKKRRRNRKSLLYDEAKVLMKPLGISTMKEFIELRDAGKLPEGIPNHPYQTYRVQDGTWKGWLDFLGVVDTKEASPLHSEASNGHEIPRTHSESKGSTSSVTEDTFSQLKSESIRSVLEKEILDLETQILISKSKLRGLKLALSELS